MFPTLGVNPPPKVRTEDEIVTFALDTEGRVAAFAACVKCGYELRTQSAAGRCTECGEPVGASLRRRWLTFSDPSRLRLIVIGAWVLIAGSVARFVVLAIALYPNFSNPITFSGGWWIDAVFISQCVEYAIVLVGVCLVTWRIKPEASGATALRWCTRVALLITVSLQFWTILIWYRSMHGDFFTFPVVLYSVLSIGSRIALVIKTGCLLWYLRTIARRVPNPRLVRWVTFVFFVVTVAYALFAIALMFSYTPWYANLTFMILTVYVPWTVGELLKLSVLVALLCSLRPALRLARQNRLLVQ